MHRLAWEALGVKNDAGIRAGIERSQRFQKALLRHVSSIAIVTHPFWPAILQKQLRLAKAVAS